ncbi:hypothetical protein MLB1_14775 [Mycobacteroides sp. LB1]|nr:hypothetical protein [Mycobacteroides sp. LB1]
MRVSRQRFDGDFDRLLAVHAEVAGEDRRCRVDGCTSDLLHLDAAGPVDPVEIQGDGPASPGLVFDRLERLGDTQADYHVHPQRPVFVLCGRLVKGDRVVVDEPVALGRGHRRTVIVRLLTLRECAGIREIFTRQQEIGGITLGRSRQAVRCRFTRDDIGARRGEQ